MIVGKVNGVLWDYLLLFLLCGTGVWFTIKLKGVQVTQFGKAFKATFGNLTLNGEKAGKDGMSSFQSLATAIAGSGWYR